MTELSFIQGGPGWRRSWKRAFGDGPGAVTVLNGIARDYGVRDPQGAFSIKWMPRGRAVYRVDGASHRLQGDRAVMLNAGQAYELEFLDRAGTESLCVFVSDDLAAQAFAALAAMDEDAEAPRCAPEFPDLVFRPAPEVTASLARLRDAYAHDDPSALAIEEGMLELVTALAAAAQVHRRVAARIPAAKPSTRRRLAARLERARELIEDCAEEPTLDQLATASALSKFHLIRLFKAAFGCTPSAYVGRRRMERARGCCAPAQ